MKKWQLFLIPLALVAALALGLAYLRFMDEADPSAPPAAPLVWAANAMHKLGLDNRWSRDIWFRQFISELPEPALTGPGDANPTAASSAPSQP